VAFPMTASASMYDLALPYEWGHTYEGNDNHCVYYYFDLEEKSNVHIEWAVIVKEDIPVAVYDEEGNICIYSGEFTYSYNQTKNQSKVTTSRVLKEGKYYVEASTEAPSHITRNYSFFATSEPAVSLDQPKIDSITSDGKGKAKVEFNEIEDSSGYQIQLCTSKKFTGTLKKADESEANASFSGLTSRKIYYARVRAYSIYSDGTTVYSAWSTVKKVKVV